MAEVVAFRNNALPYPMYGVAWTVVAPLLDADGDPVSPSSPDSEVSKNGDTFADCTNEATEIATSSGVVYLTLTATEMTADIVAVQIKSTGAKTTIITLYPRKLTVLSTGTCQGSNDTGDIQLASGDSAVDDIYNGCLVVAVIDGTTEARVINDYVGSTKVAEINPAWNTAQPDNNDTYTIYLPEGRQFAQGDTRAWAGTAAVAGAIPAVVAGGSGGLLISGSNSGTTTLGALTVSGTTTLAALSMTTLTASGAVAFQSTFAVTGATTLAALSMTTLTASGAVAFQSTFATTGTTTFNAFTVTNALTVSGATTLTGAVTGTNSSNDLRINGKVPGATDGLFIAGTNAATVVTTSFTTTFTGNLTGSVASVSGAVGSVTGAVGSVTGSVGSIASGGIAAASFAAGAINAAAIASDAITAAKIADGAIDTATFAAGTTIPRCTLVDTTTTNTDMITAASVWSVGSRTLTANTNFNDPTAAAIATAVLTTAMTEAYPADGAAATLAQAVYLVMQSLHEFAIVGTTRTVKKIDGSTTAATFTLDSSTAPTSTTRAS